MKEDYRLFLLALCIVILVIGCGLFLDQNQQTSASSQLTTIIFPGDDQSQEVVIKIYYDSQEQLNTVAGELDIWEIQRLPGIGSTSGYAVAAVSPAQKDWLDVLGFNYVIDLEKTVLLQSPTAQLDPRYYYFDADYNNSNNRYIVNFLQETNSEYLTLTELFDIGNAWQGEHGGPPRDMWVLRISNEDPAYGDISNKPPFFLFANIHAREVTTPEMAIRYIKYLTSGYDGQGGYGIDPDVTWLVDHYVAYVLVTQNPDGHRVNEQNISSNRRKNMDNDDGCTNPGTYGVDLNRNSSFKWGCCGGSSDICSSDIYRGPSPASEPETIAFQEYFASIFPDQNGPNGDNELPPAASDDSTGLFITLHTYADEILWPWGFGGISPNNAQLQTIGRKLAFLNGMYPSGFLYTVDGSTDDWVYGKFGVASFTYEIGPNNGSCGGFFPAFGCQDGIDGMPRNFWAEMKPSFIYAHKIARTPYLTAYGPDSESLIVTPKIVPAGNPVDLTASITDHRFGDDDLKPIAAAEYFIDAPGDDGTGIAMVPTDTAWGEINETVEAVVDTTGFSKGHHYILVHGKNVDGFWGPYTAVFLDINDIVQIFLPLAEK